MTKQPGAKEYFEKHTPNSYDLFTEGTRELIYSIMEGYAASKNLRTETRTPEEVREKLVHVSKKLTFYTEKPSSIYKNRKELIRELLHTISLLKWFLKEKE